MADNRTASESCCELMEEKHENSAWHIISTFCGCYYSLYCSLLYPRTTLCPTDNIIHCWHLSFNAICLAAPDIHTSTGQQLAQHFTVSNMPSLLVTVCSIPLVRQDQPRPLPHLLPTPHTLLPYTGYRLKWSLAGTIQIFILVYVHEPGFHCNRAPTILTMPTKPHCSSRLLSTLPSTEQVLGPYMDVFSHSPDEMGIIPL